ncbi:MAG: S24 family peptidase [Intestinibaculum porci]|uniref:LexA family protein n=1 Tax=Intestinibaculum porci TaxID=2487118 RepID=UPI0024091E80|nr:helix-turn-helix domain-containing protein [Intestinibaculum porci]MDD6423385.1 S24 family peptidase [Intestinibaculum porci]
MELKEFIQQYKEDQQINNSEMARRLGVTKSTIHKWLNGDVKKLQSETLQKLSQALGYDVEAVLNGQVIEFKKPILGYVKAGYNLYAEENYLGYEDVTAAENRQGDYFLQVTGDSMIGEGIMDGSLAYIKSCSDVPSGTIAVCLIGGEEVTIKRVIKKEDMIILEAANPQVSARYFSALEAATLPVQIIGRLVYVKTVF